MNALCDGREFLSSDMVAARTGASADLIRQAVARGQLCPGKVGTQLVFTRRDVERWRAWKDEHAIVEELARGAHPLDVYLRGQGAWSLEQVARVMVKWAKLAGVWVVQAPRGSYARWLDRMGLDSFTPKAMRRIIELLLTDDYVRRRAVEGLASADVRSAAAESTEPAPGDSPGASALAPE